MRADGKIGSAMHTAKKDRAGTPGAEEVVLTEPYYDVATVRVGRVRYRTSDGGEHSVLAVFLGERRFKGQPLFDHLLSAAVNDIYVDAFGGALDEEEAFRGKQMVGRYLWYRLHPDFGEGRLAAAGKRRVNFKKFFQYLADTDGASGVSAGIARLEQVGASHFRGKLPSFVEWKKMLHFPREAEVTREDVEAAVAFLDNYGPALAEHEQRHLGGRRWSSPSSKDPYRRELNKSLRRNAAPLVKAARLGEGGERAATLLSHAFINRLSNEVAAGVARRLPPMLDEVSQKVFVSMWIAEDEDMDEHGRFDIPVMASPVITGAIDYIGGFGRAKVTVRKMGLLDEVLAFATGREERNRAVNVSLGFAVLYQAYLYHTREADRERKERVRHRADLNVDLVATLPVAVHKTPCPSRGTPKPRRRRR